MFNNRFVACIRVNGKILRENQNLVSIPFGAEYDILLKNLHSRRAMVNVSVDGQDATSGRVIIAPNSSVTLERFIRNGNLSSGNRFKFIERTAGVEAFRGIGSDDSLVRCEFWAEQEAPEIKHVIHEHHYDRWRWPQQTPWLSNRFGGEQERGGFNYGRAQGGSVPPGSDVTFTANTCSAENIGSTATDFTASMNSAGITVAGSESQQQFHSAMGFPLEANSHVIVLQLRGAVGGVTASRPITVELKPTCSSCGKVNKATNKFCSECGTALFLI